VCDKERREIHRKSVCVYKREERIREEERERESGREIHSMCECVCVRWMQKPVSVFPGVKFLSLKTVLRRKQTLIVHVRIF